MSNTTPPPGEGFQYQPPAKAGGPLPPPIPLDLTQNDTPGFPGNLDPNTGFPLVNVPPPPPDQVGSPYPLVPPPSPFSGGLTPPDFPVAGAVYDETQYAQPATIQPPHIPPAGTPLPPPQPPLLAATPHYPGNINPTTGFPTGPVSIAMNPPGPTLPANNPVDPNISGSFMQGWTYQGIPYTGDSSRTINPIGMPVWFTRGSLHRAKLSRFGPYQDPAGYFTVPAGWVLIFWEIRQGTPQWTPPATDLIPTIFAILPIDTAFVAPVGGNSPTLLSGFVDPDMSLMQPGDDIAVWFAFNRPAHVIGRCRQPDEVNLGFGRNNSGGMGIR